MYRQVYVYSGIIYRPRHNGPDHHDSTTIHTGILSEKSSDPPTKRQRLRLPNVTRQRVEKANVTKQKMEKANVRLEKWATTPVTERDKTESGESERDKTENGESECETGKMDYRG